MASVGVVDNDELTLMALSGYLAGHFGEKAVLWKCTSGRKAISLCVDNASRPDVLLLDMSLSDMSGVAVCRELRSRLGTMPILAITSFPLDQYAASVAEAGGQGIVAKRNLMQIGRALLTVAREGVWADGALSESERSAFERVSVAHARLEGAGLSSPVALSEQEEVIMSLFAKGLGNGEVAERMGISENTVKTYVRRAMAKLGAKTRSQAMAEWISRKLDISM